MDERPKPKSNLFSKISKALSSSKDEISRIPNKVSQESITSNGSLNSGVLQKDGAKKQYVASMSAISEPNASTPQVVFNAIVMKAKEAKSIEILSSWPSDAIPEVEVTEEAWPVVKEMPKQLKTAADDSMRKNRAESSASQRTVPAARPRAESNIKMVDNRPRSDSTAVKGEVKPEDLMNKLRVAAASKGSPNQMSQQTIVESKTSSTAEVGGQRKNSVGASNFRPMEANGRILKQSSVPIFQTPLPFDSKRPVISRGASKPAILPVDIAPVSSFAPKSPFNTTKAAAAPVAYKNRSGSISNRQSPFATSEKKLLGDVSNDAETSKLEAVLEHKPSTKRINYSNNQHIVESDHHLVSCYPNSNLFHLDDDWTTKCTILF